MGWQFILFDEAEGVATLTLHRPERLNALTAEMHEEIAQALARVEAEAAIRALLVTGTGRGFCAGQDLAHRRPGAEGAPSAGNAIERYYNPLARRLRALPKPVIAAVNGVAAGAGANLALSADIVLAARSASFLQAFSRIGLIPDTGGTYYLPRLVGSARAMGLALLGEQIPAETAAEWGMIWRVVDDERLMPEARALAERLARGPTQSLGLIKRALNASLANDFSTQLDLERDLQEIAHKSPDYAEGVLAFLEKRPPRFSGT